MTSKQIYDEMVERLVAAQADARALATRLGELARDEALELDGEAKEAGRLQDELAQITQGLTCLGWSS